MKLYLILISLLATTSAFAGQTLPTVGAIPTAAGAGVSTHANGVSATTNTPRLSTSTSPGLAILPPMHREQAPPPLPVLALYALRRSR